MNYARGAWTVSHTGVIYYFDDYDVEDSYGSPDTSYDYILDNRNFVIEWDGSIDGLNDSDDSYGTNSPSTVLSYYAWRVNPSGGVNHDYDGDVSFSYG